MAETGETTLQEEALNNPSADITVSDPSIDMMEGNKRWSDMWVIENDIYISPSIFSSFQSEEKRTGSLLYRSSDEGITWENILKSDKIIR